MLGTGHNPDFETTDDAKAEMFRQGWKAGRADALREAPVREPTEEEHADIYAAGYDAGLREAQAAGDERLIAALNDVLWWHGLADRADAKRLAAEYVRLAPAAR